VKPAIIGLSGLHLTANEATLLRTHRPAGIILFARNIESPPQVSHLITAIRTELPANLILMIDQEGGRVARLRPPHWLAHPSAQTLARSGLRATFLSGALIGLETAGLGFTVVAAPCLDRLVPGATTAIGDRSFGADHRAVARLGRAQADGIAAAGIIPVIKHLPGHGAARVDSHYGLPTVQNHDEAADLLPFILNADLPWAMTAHIRYPAWDQDRPATLSPTIIRDIIRGRIGFEGVLVSDDLAMHALSGEPADRALATLEAGCDLALYCAGDFGPTQKLLESCPPMPDQTAERLALGREYADSRRLPLNSASLLKERDRLLA
jgi:beta-N-acetylhexosaminidase